MAFKFKLSFLPSLNRIVRYFIISDLFLWSGWGFIDPIFSIFVVRNIEGATLESIGYLAAIFWVTRSVVQIPISLFLDKTDGEKDDFYALILGLLITGVAAFSFMAAKNMPTVYFIQFIKAAGFSLYIPAWASIFTRHMDRKHTAFEWAISSSSVSLGIGAAGFFGALIAASLGYNFVFLITGLMAIISAAILIFVPNLILPKKTISSPEVVGDHIRAGLK